VVTMINHPPVITINRWYKPKIWVVYGIVLPHSYIVLSYEEHEAPGWIRSMPSSGFFFRVIPCFFSCWRVPSGKLTVCELESYQLVDHLPIIAWWFSIANC
jgi:hypothetical protein